MGGCLGLRCACISMDKWLLVAQHSFARLRLRKSADAELFCRSQRIANLVVENSRVKLGCACVRLFVRCCRRIPGKQSSSVATGTLWLSGGCSVVCISQAAQISRRACADSNEEFESRRNMLHTAVSA